MNRPIASIVLSSLGFVVLLFGGIGACSATLPRSFTDRFQNDNAIGAAANAIERLERAAPSYGWAILGATLCIGGLMLWQIALLQKLVEQGQQQKRALQRPADIADLPRPRVSDPL